MAPNIWFSAEVREGFKIGVTQWLYLRLGDCALVYINSIPAHMFPFLQLSLFGLEE